MQHPVFPAGLNSNVAGRTPDIVIVPLPGVVYASPQAKVSEHGGLMKVGSAFWQAGHFFIGLCKQAFGSRCQSYTCCSQRALLVA